MAASKKALIETVAHFGMCDASAGIFISQDLFAAADDERNVLNIYGTDSITPVKAVSLERFLIRGRKKGEADIEGAAKIGNRIYWITSHGLNSKGVDQQSRENFFAMEVISTGRNAELVPVGISYRTLRDDLIAAPSLKAYKLAEAAELAPKETGAFNIEGLAAGPNGTVLIGFRNPLPQNKSLIIPLLNPAELVEGKPGVKAKFGEAMLADLGGHGIRDMLLHSSGQYFLLSGSYKSGGSNNLYKWDPKTNTVALVQNFAKQKVNPEGILEIPGSPAELLVLSDDGNRTLKKSNVACKDLPPTQRSFRSFRVSIK